MRSGDEHVGLTQAIMTAGAGTVVGSLWSVNDKATSALFEVFYANIAANQPPAIALRQAQEELQRRTHWEHPYYWAAFIASGLAHNPVEQLTTSPTLASELSARLDGMNSESKQRGNPMNEERMIKEVKIAVKQMRKYHRRVIKQLSPIETHLVVDSLATLTEKAGSAQSEADLLSIANAMQTLIEEIAGLRTLLTEKQLDVAQARQQRTVILADHQATMEGDQAARASILSFTNMLVECRDKFAQQLPDPEQEISNDATYRQQLRELWNKMWGRG